jgi:Ribonuclease G/E
MAVRRRVLSRRMRVCRRCRGHGHVVRVGRRVVDAVRTARRHARDAG